MRILLISAIVAVLVFFATAAPCRADDYYIIDMYAVGAPLPNDCTRLVWDSDTVFYNDTGSAASISLLGVSNGGVDAGVPLSLDLPASRATSIRESIGLDWQPRSPSGGNEPALWVEHVSVPANVHVDSEMFPSLSNQSCSFGVVFESHPFGKVRLPVFRGLVPAGQRQLLTGLTLGDQATRINVSIYNSSANVASASIEIHRACDGALLDTRTVVLPADTIQQFGGFGVTNVPPDCALDRLAYAVVTVDQPSLSFASIIANGQTPQATIQVCDSTQ